MLELLDRPECKEMLSKCNSVRVPLSQGEAHETFCCKKVLIIVSDKNGDEAALAMEQTYSHSPGKSVTRFTKIRLGDTIYALRVPL